MEQVEQVLELSGQGDDMTRCGTGIVTRNTAMQRLLSQANQVAATESSVLIFGSSGTGKELLAKAIHKASGRRGEFVAINCAAIPESLLESELFGFKRGAFTGALHTHAGLLVTADGGSLLLDEVGDMPLALQAKLLRILEEKSVRPLGSDRTKRIDVRVISATHRDLEAEVAAGRFRQDLYYRLNVISLHVPPLVARREDIPLLVLAKLDRLARHNGGKEKFLTPGAVELLVAAEWPGNVRQLFNIVEHCAALCPNRIISADVVRCALGSEAEPLPSLAEARAHFTRTYLTQLLKITSGNVSKAARLAKHNRTDFYKLLARYNIQHGDFKEVR